MNKTWMLFVDELTGFAKSTVMIAMWVGLPLMGLGLYFILPDKLPTSPGAEEMGIILPASTFLALSLSTTGGLLASVLVSIDVVNEKTKKVYDLFLIRPVNRSSFMWSKFFAVTFTVSIAIALAMFAGILVDLIRGVEISPLMRETIVEKYISAVGVVVISTASGVLIGMISNTVLIAVLLVFFIAQNIMLIPLLAAFFSNNWVVSISLGITLLLSLAMMFISTALFKRMET